MTQSLMVGMAEVKISRHPGEVLIALGLGSCIGVCAYDPKAHVAGLAHVVLPDSAGHPPSPHKFADTAIPLLLEAMQQAGASPSRVLVALTGGAQLFTFQGSGPRLEIGARNAVACVAALQARRLPIAATDLGGSTGRTVQLFNDGRVHVKTIGQGERQLVALGEVAKP